MSPICFLKKKRRDQQSGRQSIGNQPSWKGRKGILKNEDLCGNIKHTNICIIRVPEEKKEKGAENLFEEIRGEIIGVNFPDLEKETNMQVQ